MFEFICLSCWCRFNFDYQRLGYPYCRECGSGNTGYYTEEGILVKNN